MEENNYHLNAYLKRLADIAPAVPESVKDTVNIIIPDYFEKSSGKDDITGLLLGNVQSGKTSQIFGLVSAAADLSDYNLFILLTTDNVYLQEQTYRRALQSLDTFNICGENDHARFFEKGLRQPILIVLKKNTNVLKTWKKNLQSSKYCQACPLVIVDDEADAASLNTKVNQKEQSTINQHLKDIKKLACGSIHIQVTATPQAVLLQTKDTGFKPAFVHYFPPGKNYLGGYFFYSDPKSYAVKITKENELSTIRNGNEEDIPEGLRKSLLSFLTASAHIFLNGGKASNFLVHPSVSIKDHDITAESLGRCLNEMLQGDPETEIFPALKDEWQDLQKSKPEIVQFNQIKKFIMDAIESERIRIIVLNSKSRYENSSYEGMNIIVGGNSLGRGVTFPALQTVYYCRKSKYPQADTFWQHCRMFGYDRDRGLVRVFMPPTLLKLFTELNEANSILIEQIKQNKIDDISILYPPKIRPSRPSVIDKKALNMIVGGTDYFPCLPIEKNTEILDNMLLSYSDKDYTLQKIDFIIKLLSKFASESKLDWNSQDFINGLLALVAKEPELHAALIVRTDRDISKGTGTLLSPDDRQLGRRFFDKPVLTVYRLTGRKEKGWEGEPFWIPNIKLPQGKVFYRSND
jgi:hypothetical protein